MKREELSKELSGRYIGEDEQREYFCRLAVPYKNAGEAGKTNFAMQFSEGDGSELRKKFWSVRSSSRYAFEMYSWMASSKKYNCIQFEKKLKGLKGYSVGVPNMDVYFETDDTITFIESKLLEFTKLNLNGLKDSYYKEKGESNHVKGKLEDRYYGNEYFAKKISEFIKEVELKIEQYQTFDKNDYFDIKQEITHIIGIILFIWNSDAETPGMYADKNIEFFNVVYMNNKESKERYTGENIHVFKKWFIKNAIKLVEECVGDKINSFSYDTKNSKEYIDSILEDKNQLAWGCKKETVKERLEIFHAEIERIE